MQLLFFLAFAIVLKDFHKTLATNPLQRGALATVLFT